MNEVTGVIDGKQVGVATFNNVFIVIDLVR